MVIVDAGGGTIDVSAYKRVSSATKAKFKEVSVPQCECLGPVRDVLNADLDIGYFQGSVFVTFRARDFLKGMF